MEKQIFIHVGPPKTGTSAAQQWFNENESLIGKFGVYYPTHSVDSNGISSGNVGAIYDLNEQKQIVLNLGKLKSLISHFENSHFQILFLSSEFFFKKMEELKQHIPNSKFIAYIRNPMEVKESTYNQSVKRHFQVELLKTKQSPRIATLDRFLSFKRQHGNQDLIFRLYGNKYFQNGNIVTDLLSILNIDLHVSIPSINRSYQFEVLEFKRWFNQFELHEFQVIVDAALQAYTKGVKDYSLIPAQQYIEDSHHYSSVIKDYARKLATESLTPLVEDMQIVESKPYYSQVLSKESFLSVCHFLRDSLDFRFFELAHAVKHSKRTANDEFLAIFINYYHSERTLKFYWFYLFTKFKSLMRTAKKIIYKIPTVKHLKR